MLITLLENYSSTGPADEASVWQAYVIKIIQGQEHLIQAGKLWPVVVEARLRTPGRLMNSANDPFVRFLRGDRVIGSESVGLSEGIREFSCVGWAETCTYCSCRLTSSLPSATVAAAGAATIAAAAATTKTSVG